MVVEQGEVWWADLGDPIGSEPGYRRPVVIVGLDQDSGHLGSPGA
jgi:mRNA interferase MazF